MIKPSRLLPLIALSLLMLALAFGLMHKPALEARQKASQKQYDIPAFALPLLGQQDGRFGPESWQGKTVVLNVFASWCEPCAAEHPVLLRLAERGRITLLGLAWKDKPENVQAWLEKRGNPFSAVGLDEKGESTVALGLSGVPETFVIHDGRVVYNYKSALTDDMIDEIIATAERAAHE